MSFGMTGSSQELKILFNYMMFHIIISNFINRYIGTNEKVVISMLKSKSSVHFEV